MGMDLVGFEPTNDVGAYFRRNICRWHPLASLVQEIAPDIAELCDSWYTNDGCGLGTDEAIKLADLLDQAIATGMVSEWIKGLLAWQADLPDEECVACHGDVGNKPSGNGAASNACLVCKGRGHYRPSAALVVLDVDDVREFSTFVRASGGFAIW